MKEKVKILTGQASEEEISKWKKQFGEIFAAKVEDHIAYFRKPTRQELGYIMTLGNNPMKQTENLLQTCFAGGSETILQDDSYFLGAASVMQQLLAVKRAEVEKL